MSAIIELKVQNVKRLSAVHVFPQGSVVVVGGRNEQGKSSVLDAIMYGLGGQATKPREPLRRETKKGEIIIKLDNGYTIRRLVNDSGIGPAVITHEKATLNTPQKILDALYSDLTFDPLAFARMSDREQVGTIKALAGVDTTKLDADRLDAYTERTGVNRDLKAVQAQVDACLHFPDAPKEEIKTSELLAEVDAIAKHNREQDAIAKSQLDKSDHILRLDSEIEKATEEIALLQTQIRAKAAAKAELLSAIDSMPAPEYRDARELRDRMAGAEAVNAKVRQNAKRKGLEVRLAEAEKSSQWFTDKIEALDAQKAELLASAKLPVEGLTWDEDGVRFAGTAFSECSQAQKIRVSVAMGFALNPNLKVLLVRDASLLDSDNLKLVADMAEAAGGQVWLERVSETGEGCSIVIEDGTQKAVVNE